MSLEDDLRAVLNQYSRENRSDTPDFILAEYVIRCLDALDGAVRVRDRWYGGTPGIWLCSPRRHDLPTQASPEPPPFADLPQPGALPDPYGGT